MGGTVIPRSPGFCVNVCGALNGGYSLCLLLFITERGQQVAGWCKLRLLQVVAELGDILFVKDTWRTFPI